VDPGSGRSMRAGRAQRYSLALGVCYGLPAILLEARNIGTDLLRHVSSGFGKRVKPSEIRRWMVHAFLRRFGCWVYDVGNSDSEVHPQDKFYVQLEVYGVGAQQLTAISCFSVAAAAASPQPAQQVEHLQQHHLHLRSPLQRPS
jgi:hypothetical protein